MVTINISLALFSSPAQKELWWLKLSELIQVERSHSPAGASINVTYFDSATNFEHVSIRHSLSSELYRFYDEENSKVFFSQKCNKELAALAAGTAEIKDCNISI